MNKQSLSEELNALAAHARHWIPAHGWRFDFCLATQILMLADQAARLETALTIAREREAAAAAIAAYLQRPATRRPTPPRRCSQVAPRRLPAPPRAHIAPSALVVFSD